ncbi:MAG: gas vesicle protein GvpJ [Thermodesulfovibrionales bacterium]|nr:gas vesicle protein GvpJ [Thermodesulfovibrionales bacterium]
MEPSRNTHATLVDLLDRILDKGLVINADIIISVAGIPLIGVNLRAALAGMETMLKYGMMKAWDEKIRAWEREHWKKNTPSLVEGEEITLKMHGSYYYSKGIYNAWRPGYFYLTNKRLILYRQDFDEITFQIPLEEIKALVMREEAHFVKEKKKQVLYLMDKQDQVHRLSAVETNQLKDAIEQNLETTGLSLEESPVLPEFEEGPIDFLTEGEEVTHRGEKVWYLVPASGIQQETWKPGHLYITNKRLCWWCDFEKRLAFEVPTEKILGSTIEVRNLSPVLKKKRIFDVIYEDTTERKVASFSGDGMFEWERVLARIISFRERIEACPQCGKKAIVLELLEKGCPNCGWVSHRLKKKITKVALSAE